MSLYCSISSFNRCLWFSRILMRFSTSARRSGPVVLSILASSSLMKFLTLSYSLRRSSLYSEEFSFRPTTSESDETMNLSIPGHETCISNSLTAL